jgi:hypothetical protein
MATLTKLFSISIVASKSLGLVTSSNTFSSLLLPLSLHLFKSLADNEKKATSDPETIALINRSARRINPLISMNRESPPKSSATRYGLGGSSRDVSNDNVFDTTIKMAGHPDLYPRPHLRLPEWFHDMKNLQVRKDNCLETVLHFSDLAWSCYHQQLRWCIG